MFFVHTPLNIINYVIFNKQKPTGTQHTAGFIAHYMIYGLVWVLPSCGYGVHRFRYSMRKPNPQVTYIEPYMFIYTSFMSCPLIFHITY